MDRKEELLSLIEQEDIKCLITPTIERLIYLEEKLKELEKLPFIKIHPTDPSKQKELPARKQYIAFLQQYNLVLFKVLKVIGIDTNDDDESLSAFTKYMSELNEKLYQD